MSKDQKQKPEEQSTPLPQTLPSPESIPSSPSSSESASEKVQNEKQNLDQAHPSDSPKEHATREPGPSDSYDDRLDKVPAKLDIRNTVHVIINGFVMKGYAAIRTLTTPNQTGWIETKIKAKDKILSQTVCKVTNKDDETTLEIDLLREEYHWPERGPRIQMNIFLPITAKTVTLSTNRMVVELRAVAVEDEINIKTTNAPIYVQKRCSSKRLLLTTERATIDTHSVDHVRVSQLLHFNSSDGNIQLGPIQADTAEIDIKTSNGNIAAHRFDSCNCSRLTLGTSNGSVDFGQVDIATQNQAHIYTSNGYIKLKKIRVENGDLDMSTQNAKIVAKSVCVQGSLDISTTNGGIYISKLTTGAAKVTTSNAPLDLERVITDQLAAKTSNSAIFATLAERNHVNASFESNNGKILARLPSTFLGELDVKTSNARASVEGNDIELEIDEYAHKKGKVGQPSADGESAKVSIRTTNSDAKLQFNSN